MANEYRVRKKNGFWWVLTPDGEAIAVRHKTKSEAQMIANVFNHTKRDPRTVRTLADGKKDYVLVVVRGGVADLAICPQGVEVDILDFDNLKDTAPGDAILSDKNGHTSRKMIPRNMLACKVKTCLLS